MFSGKLAPSHLRLGSHTEPGTPGSPALGRCSLQSPPWAPARGYENRSPTETHRQIQICTVRIYYSNGPAAFRMFEKQDQ